MDKKQGLQNTFDTVAAGYDHPALSFFPKTAQQMVKHLGVKPTSKLLDVCTGTGVVALQAASQISEGSVTGIDLSAGMLAVAQSKADQKQLDNVVFSQMDLDQLDFPDDYFDLATCSFGLFFLDDMEQGLKNIASKITAGGKIAISTFNESAFEPMSTLFLERYATFGYDIPPLSWKQMTTDEQLTDIFAKAGMTSITIHRSPLGFHLSSPEDWWDVVWNAGYRGLLNQMTLEEQEAFKAQHLAEIQVLIDNGDHWLDTGVAIAIGVIPDAS